MIGAGGGGDVVGALGVARLCEAAGTPFVLGGVAWERFAIDPRPGPRPVVEIIGGRPLGGHAVLCDAETATIDGIRFSEAHAARHLGAETVLVDVTGGAAGAAAGMRAAAAALGCDLVIGVDVGGDILARGDEPGLASPLCDAIMLAGLAALERPALLAVIGAGCDGELTPAEVLDRIAIAGRAGAWLGTWGVEPSIADELEEAALASYTEASLQVVRCARGELGDVPIREGRRTVSLGPVGALAFFLDPRREPGRVAPLAAAVAGTATLEQAREALAALGVRTELDYERDRAAAAGS